MSLEKQLKDTLAHLNQEEHKELIGQIEAALAKLAPKKEESAPVEEELTEEQIKKRAARAEKKRLAAEKKAAKKAKQEEALRQQRLKTFPPVTFDDMQNLKAQFGVAPFHQSQGGYTPTLTEMKNINKSMDGQTVCIRGRIHQTRGGNKNCFAIVRDGLFSIQVVATASEELPKEAVKFIFKSPKETIVDVYGKVTVPESPIDTCSQGDVELQMTHCFAIVMAESGNQHSVVDAMKSDEILRQLAEKAKKKGNQKEGRDQSRDAGRKVRLDNRCIDLRAPAHIAILKMSSMVGHLFREYLMGQGFTEIHTPKLLGAASEGGADVFRVDYFGGNAYLAQSPQLYKQMGVQSGLKRVFEIGPVFRAENSNTHRHLTEFVGLDLEMEFKNHYHEVLDVMDQMFIHIFNGLNKNCQEEMKAIAKQYPFNPLKFDQKKNLRITYAEGMKMLRAAGVEIGDLEDIGTPEEKKLGALIKEKYGTDFYFMDKFPMAVRPFYTMPDPKNKEVSNSYDLFIRGEEISSGAQRIHDVNVLIKCGEEKEVDMTPLKGYMDAFRAAGYYHGGCGIGLERVVMLFLALPNVRKVSMFPRDPKRLYP